MNNFFWYAIMLHITPISLPSKSKDMEYSVDFENMVKSHQDKFIGYGNPNAKILIIVPKKDVEGIISFSAGRYNTQFIIFIVCENLVIIWI